MDLLDAIILATRAHDGQRRKYSDEPYIIHPLEVARRVADLGEEAQIVAVLHDVVEDTDHTIRSLEHEGLLARLSTSVAMLTRQSNESYSEYISQLLGAGNVMELQIKLADVEHNLSTRPEGHSLVVRYTATRAKLLARLAELGVGA